MKDVSANQDIKEDKLGEDQERVHITGLSTGTHGSSQYSCVSKVVAAGVKVSSKRMREGRTREKKVCPD
jgi:poly(3-hydroxybutyrate) depolymerase